MIFRLHEELEKRNLKTEEVLLVLQGVTMGLKATRNDSTCFSRVQQTELRPPDGPFRPGLMVYESYKSKVSFVIEMDEVKNTEDPG